MKTIFLIIFICGAIVGWGVSTILWQKVMRDEVKSVLERTVKNGILKDKYGNIYIAIPK